MAKCTCHITGDSGSTSGLFRLSQTSEDSPTTIEGDVKGLSPGKHAISINIFGDLSNGSSSCGPIFNPFGKNHGAPDDDERMVGDLGNLNMGDDGKCTVRMEDKIVKLIGPHSVIGRSIVIHAGEDDCGRGGHEASLSTGNSGASLAAGVIGLSA